MVFNVGHGDFAFIIHITYLFYFVPFKTINKILWTHINTIRGARTSKGQGGGGGGGQLFQRALSILYVQLLPFTLQTYYQAIKHFNKAGVLSMSHKY